MSNFPNDIFSRLELLKKWQEEQQQRLLQQQKGSNSEKLREALDSPLSSLRQDDTKNESTESTLKFVDTSTLQSGDCLSLRCGETPELISGEESLKYVETPMIKTSEIKPSLLMKNVETPPVDNPSEMNKESKMDYPMLKNVETPALKPKILKPLNIDEQEIPTTFTDFNQLLDEKLKKIDEENVDIITKPKRPFLKKGTGLVRFRLQPQPLQRSTPKEKIVGKENVTGSNGKKLDMSKSTEPSKLSNVVSKVSNIKSTESSNKTSAQNVRFDEKSIVKHEEKPTWANVLETTQEQSLEQRAFEKQLEREVLGRDVEELQIFELLEQKASNSSFSSTSSVIMRLLGMTTTPKKQFESKPTENCNTQYSSSSRNCNAQFDSPSHSIKSHDTDYKDESAWSEESEESTLSESETESTVSESVQPIYQNVATNTDPVPEPINADLLRIRLEELEKEIETFRSENAKVQKLKITIEKERRKIEKDMEEERKNFEEEKKKLSRDKHLLHEKYTRELKNGITRKEREEITVLKNELSAVKEELKQKESRYGASQARQRNQLRTMEKEIAMLKAENDKLRKQNAKLQTQIKLDNKKNQPPSDTKVLHEINKNLSLLTKQQQRLRTTSENSNQSSDKENDSMTDPQFESIVKDYERVFGRHKSNKSQNTKLSRMDTRASSDSTDSLLEKTKPKSSTAVADRFERLLPDGSKEITYSNGNIKTIAGNKVTMRYYNGDIKETNAENATVRYFYAEASIWHTTYAEDGLEVLEFPDGQVEKRNHDGSTEVMFPDGCVRCTTPDGTETIDFPDGTVVVKKTNGEKILTLPNGQREVHTLEHKRREYPDGTVKLLYPDGTQETRYANGRIRLKDSNGVLIMDTADD